MKSQKVLALALSAGIGLSLLAPASIALADGPIESPAVAEEVAPVAETPLPEPAPAPEPVPASEPAPAAEPAPVAEPAPIEDAGETVSEQPGDASSGETSPGDAETGTEPVDAVTAVAEATPVTGQTAELLPAGTLAGTVTTSGGAPAAGAEITLIQAGGNITGFVQPSGGFTMGGLQVGEYRVRVQLAGHPRYPSAGYVTVTVVPGKVTQLDVVLEDFAQVGGSVADANGNALAGAHVYLRSSAVTLSATTDAAGAFAFADVDPGAYTMQAVAPAGTSWKSEFWSDAPYATSATTIALGSGDTFTGAFELESGSVVAGSTQYQNAAIAGVVVELEFGDGSIVADATSDATGAFSTQGVPDGDYVLTATGMAGTTEVRSAPMLVTVAGGSVTGLLVTLQPYVPAVAGPVVALPDSYAVPADGLLQVGSAAGLLSNDSTPTGDELLVDGVPFGVKHGELFVQSDGSFVYQPDAGYIGSDSFSYTVVDERADPSQARVMIVVSAPLVTTPTSSTSTSGTSDDAATTAGSSDSLALTGSDSSGTFFAGMLLLMGGAMLLVRRISARRNGLPDRAPAS